MRCLGMPVVPPVSKMLNGRPLKALGTQTSGCRSRNHSSWKCGKRVRSSKHLISVAGLQPAFLAHSSQKGDPVSGEKCHCTISRARASSWSCADWTAVLLTAGASVAVADIGRIEFMIYDLRFVIWIAREESPSEDLLVLLGLFQWQIHCWHFIFAGHVARRFVKGVKMVLGGHVNHAVGDDWRRVNGRA